MTAPSSNLPLRIWLTELALRGATVAELFDAYCRRLRDDGLALCRAYIGMMALDPVVRAQALRWEPAVGVVVDNFHHNHDIVGWVASPQYYMLNNGIPRMRRRLAGPQAQADFPILVELAAGGATDWLALIWDFGPLGGHPESMQGGMVSSWATAQADGFSDANLALLDDSAPTFALAVKCAMAGSTLNSVLGTYLGRDAASRVLSGQILRGGTASLRAALFFADLRGFTAFAEDQPAEAVVAALDTYCDAIGSAVAAQGGQILKFMGDGALATFAPPPGSGAAGEAQSCRAALAAAHAALAQVDGINAGRIAAGMKALPLSVALHFGEVRYGNVGAAERLDFTVVGPAVNLAARLEALCKTLERPLLASASFAATLGPEAAGLASLGRHALRGVAQPTEVFGPA